MSLSHNILPHFSSSQLSSLNAISSCLPHNPLAHQYISNIMLTKRRKIHIQSVIVPCQCFPSSTVRSGKIWMNFWFRSISHALVLIFLLSSLSEHSFPFSSIFCRVSETRVRKKRVGNHKQSYAINLRGDQEERRAQLLMYQTFYWNNELMIFEKRLYYWIWVRTSEKERERLLLTIERKENRYCHCNSEWVENFIIIVVLNFYSFQFLHCCTLEFPFHPKL